MSNNYKIYDLTVSTVTPLHIGTGTDLLHEYDYAIHGGKTWRLNEAELLDAVYTDDPKLADQLARTAPAELLEKKDFREDSKFFRYVIQGTPRSSRKGAQLQEEIKTVDDHPYLPGSSLKGALRTAIAWYAWDKKNLKAEVSNLRRYAKFAAQNYEKDIFGKNPNYDFMRALHIADSAEVEKDRLMVLNIRALNQSGELQAPIEAEAIRPDTIFKMSLKIDTALYSDWAKQKRFHLGGRNFLEALPQVLHAHSRQQIESELAWYKKNESATRLASFYTQLENLTKKPSSTQFLLQLGAGTGWSDKTFGSHLKKSDRFMNTILKSRRDGGYGVARKRPPRNVQEFPLSRRVAVAFRRRDDGMMMENPAYPLGWVLVEMKERENRNQ